MTLRFKTGAFGPLGVILMQVPELIYPEGEFSGLVDTLTPETKPPLEQVSIFPTTTDLVYEMLPDLLREYKTKITRIRKIAEKYDISENQARKHYDEAYRRFVHELNYKHYCKNKDWFEWIVSPEGREHIQKQEQERIQRMQQAETDMESRIKEGTEHIVEIAPDLDSDIVHILDNYMLARFYYHGPFTSYISITIVTEHDTKVLLKNNYIEILEGDPDTILNYKFSTKAIGERVFRLKCNDCGKYLDYNDVGLNKKLGNEDKDNYKCPACLGMSEQQAISIMSFYKSNGCYMFV